MHSDLRGEETAELLSTLIRNGCVNDGSPASGNESLNAAAISGYLGAVDYDVFAPEGLGHRRSLVARLGGTDPTAPTLLLLGHTDVVPVNPANWSRDPFGGDVVDGEVWGRGAVDMLNQTAAMAVAFKRWPNHHGVFGAPCCTPQSPMRRQAGSRESPICSSTMPSSCVRTPCSPRRVAPSRRRARALY